MEIKPGYKQTEIGVIPDDWEVKELKEITSGIGDGIHSTPEYSQRSDYFFINGNNLANGRILFDDNTKSISEREYSKYKTRLTDRTLLLSINGTIGNIAKYNGERILLGKSAAYMTLLSHIDVAFVYYMLQTDNVISYFNNELTGSTIKNLSLLTLRLTPIPSPSNNREKMLISESLSDIDSLITSLEKLIEKKKHIKQGVMQELLTGKSRLPGFSGEWETKRLGDLCSHITTGRKDVNEGNPNGMYPFFTCSRAITYSDHFSFDTEAILIAGNGDVGTLHYFTGKFEAYQRTYVLTGFSVKARYLVHYLNMYLVPTLCDSKIGTSIPYIKIGDLINMPVIVPMDDAEVKHVISVIDDIELEIDMHVVQLKKHELLKQAMMQELLTGRIRLV